MGEGSRGTIVEGNRIGTDAEGMAARPNLFGIVGRKAGSIEGFRYSANMRSLAEGGLVWSEDRLRAYVQNPKAVVPQGSMSFPGLRNETQINDLMAYLATLK